MDGTLSENKGYQVAEPDYDVPVALITMNAACSDNREII